MTPTPDPLRAALVHIRDCPEDGLTPAVMVGHLKAEACAALAQPSPPLDAERLRQAMILSGWPAAGSTTTAGTIAAEYARLSEPKP